MDGAYLPLLQTNLICSFQRRRVSFWKGCPNCRRFCLDAQCWASRRSHSVRCYGCSRVLDRVVACIKPLYSCYFDIYIYIVGAPGLGSLQYNSVLDFTIEEWQAERTVPPWQVLDNWKSAESKPVFSSQAYASTKNGKSPKFLPSFFLFQCSAGHVAKQYEILGKHVEDYCCRL